jgi:hypothetical protein
VPREPFSPVETGEETGDAFVDDTAGLCLRNRRPASLLQPIEDYVMRSPFMKITVRQSVVAVAIVAVICGAEMMRRRRVTLLEQATTVDWEEFKLRGEARRLDLLANLFENPPHTDDELREKWEEMHPLPHIGCTGWYPTMEDLTQLGEDGRRIRAQIYRRVAGDYLEQAAILGRQRRDLQSAAFFPWESNPPDRPLPTRSTFRPTEGLSVDQLRSLVKARREPTAWWRLGF